MENFGRIDPSTGIHSRLLDFLNSFDQIIEIAKKERVAAVIFTGDAYRTREPSPTAEREFAKRIRALLAANIEILLLVGNHDVPNMQGRANAIDVFRALKIPGLYVSRQPEIVKMLNGKLQVITLPWVNPAFLLAKRDLNPEKLHQTILESLDAIWQELLSRAREEKLPTIAAVHGSIEGAVYGSETSVLFGSDLPLPKNWFLEEPIIYTAAGHIHKYQAIKAEKPIVYAGSPDYIDFGEEREKKGLVVIEIKENSLDYKFLPITVRPLLTIMVKVKSDSPTKEIVDAINASDLKDKIVRVKISATTAKRQATSEREIYAALKGAYHISGIFWDITPEYKTVSQAMNLAQKSPEELLRLYFKKKVSEKRALELLKLFKESNKKD